MEESFHFLPFCFDWVGTPSCCVIWQECHSVVHYPQVAIFITLRWQFGGKDAILSRQWGAVLWRRHGNLSIKNRWCHFEWLTGRRICTCCQSFKKVRKWRFSCVFRKQTYLVGCTFSHDLICFITCCYLNSHVCFCFPMVSRPFLLLFFPRPHPSPKPDSLGLLRRHFVFLVFPGVFIFSRCCPALLIFFPWLKTILSLIPRLSFVYSCIPEL